MSHPRFPSYVRRVLAFLRGIGALVHTSADRPFRPSIRYRGRHASFDLPRHTSDPERCAARAIAEISRTLGLAGVVA